MSTNEPPIPDTDDTLGLLHGAEEIAAFLYGDRRYARRVRNHAENRTLPIFPVGKILHAMKSDLVADIADKKSRSTANSRKPRK